MRIAIFGAGSLGIVLGAYLTRGGLDVTLIHRRREQVEALRQNGAVVCGQTDLRVPVKAALTEEMGGGWDLIFLMTKQLDNRNTALFLKDKLSEDGLLCTLQNGLPETELAEVLGSRRVLGCTVAWGATLDAPGVSRLTSDPASMSFGLGPAEGAWDERCERVRNVLEKMCPVEAVDNLSGTRWSKLLINAAFSGMGTVIGGTFGDAAADPTSRRLCLGVIQECLNTADALHVQIAPVQGKDIVKLFRYRTPIKKRFALAILPIAIKKHARIEPSMLQDLYKGKKCEINAINGAVCDAGDRVNVDTPINDRVRDVVLRIEKGELKPGIGNLSLFRDLTY